MKHWPWKYILSLIFSGYAFATLIVAGTWVVFILIMSCITKWYPGVSPAVTAERTLMLVDFAAKTCVFLISGGISALFSKILRPK